MTFRRIALANANPDMESVLEQCAVMQTLYSGNQADTVAVLDAVGGAELLVWRRTAGALLPAWCMARQGQHTYLWIAGTTTVRQLLNQIGGAIASTDAGGYHVGTFWREIWRDHLQPLVLDALGGFPGGSYLTITGDSYGGAVACLAANDLAAIYGGSSIELLTFAAPKALTDGYTGPGPVFHWRVARVDDPVPILPPTAGSWVQISTSLAGGLAVGRPLPWAHYGNGYRLDTGGLLFPDNDDSLTGWAPDYRIAGLDTAQHSLSGTSAILGGNALIPGRLTDRGRQIGLFLLQLASRQVDPATLIDSPPGRGIIISEANTAYFGSTQGPLTASNIGGVTLLALPAPIQTPGGLGNIQGSLGGGKMSSGIWKGTMLIKAGNYGRSVTFYYSTSTGALVDTALAAFKKVAEKYSDCFGTAFVNPNNSGGSATTPQVMYIRVTDALVRNPGVLKDVSSSAYTGHAPNQDDNHADFISTALSLRLRGSTVDGTQPPPNNVVYGFSNHALLGIPDSVVVDSAIVWSVPMGVTGTFSTAVKNLVNHLNDPVNSLGFLGIDPASPRKPGKKFEFVGGLWQGTVPAHGWGDRDRVRITGANNSYFNGTYKIGVVDANTIAIANGPPSGVAPATSFDARRVQLQNGTKLLVFYRFNISALQLTEPFNCFVTKRNLAKVFNPVSFPKRKKRPR